MAPTGCEPDGAAAPWQQRSFDDLFTEVEQLAEEMCEYVAAIEIDLERRRLCHNTLGSLLLRVVGRPS